MNEVVVLTYLDKIYERKFKIKILVKFKKNYMCSIEMKPLWAVGAAAKNRLEPKTNPPYPSLICPNRKPNVSQIFSTAWMLLPLGEATVSFTDLGKFNLVAV